MIEEIWEPITGSPKYEVSNMGRVRSLNYNNTSNGYHWVFAKKESEVYDA